MRRCYEREVEEESGLVDKKVGTGIKEGSR